MRKMITIQNKLTNRDQQSMVKYLNEINADPRTLPLTPDEEARLFLEWKSTGDKKIKDRLILSNARFVITMAKQYENGKAKFEDLVQAGNIGLIKALDKYDVTYGTRILSFAGWDIMQEIQAYVNETIADIVQPANRSRIKTAVKRATQMLIEDGHENPSIDQVVDMYTKIKDSEPNKYKNLPNLNPRLLAEINANHKAFISASLGFSGKNSTEEDFALEDTFRASDDFSTDYNIDREDTNTEIAIILSALLSEREQMIVEYSFGLNGREEKTPEQIADIMGYTRERIGQLLQGALNTLRNNKKAITSKLSSTKHTGSALAILSLQTLNNH